MVPKRLSLSFHGHYSIERTLTCGVPQGIYLGPLLYNIHANEMPLILEKAKVAMYADDSPLYSSAQTFNELKIILDKE